MYRLPIGAILQHAGCNTTPFFIYDLQLLKSTIAEASRAASRYGFELHYALKANSNPEILRLISNTVSGADCVSGNEVLAALQYGFKPGKIAFAGVGKTDREIDIVLYKTSSASMWSRCRNWRSLINVHLWQEKKPRLRCGSILVSMPRPITTLPPDSRKTNLA